MELWIDTINFDLIKKACDTHPVAGVTTNPLILKEVDMMPEKIIETLLTIQPGRIASQVVAHDVEGMVRQAQKLSSIDRRMIIKLPSTQIGFQAMHRLKEKKIPFLATTVFRPQQLMLAELVGAEYAAPFLGFFDNQKQHPFDQLQDMQNIVEKQRYSVKLIGAALNSVEEFMACVRLGLPAITVPEAIYTSLFELSPGTKNMLQKFKEGWESNPYREKSSLFL